MLRRHNLVLGTPSESSAASRKPCPTKQSWNQITGDKIAGATGRRGSTVHHT